MMQRLTGVGLVLQVFGHKDCNFCISLMAALNKIVMDDQLYVIPRGEWMSVANYMAILLIASSVRHKETVAASSHCTKMKSKYPQYRHCHLVLVMKSGAKVCAVVPRRRSCNPEIHLIGLPNLSIMT